MADMSLFVVADWVPILVFSILIVLTLIYENIYTSNYFTVKLLAFVGVLYLISVVIFAFAVSVVTREQVTFYVGSATLSKMKAGFIIGYTVRVISLVASTIFKDRSDSPPPKIELIPIRAAGTMTEIGVIFGFIVAVIFAPETIAQLTPAAELDSGNIREAILPSLSALLAFQFVIVAERLLQAIEYGYRNQKLTKLR
ncbi:hypothetical protein [Halorubrum distributum]|uniref:hypothetical protein n=1 Tax=Halorubrum distributum TaxID=29283 RepID=UPI0012673FAC|nr:hypothetical protein [Halorubrum distributum]